MAFQILLLTNQLVEEAKQSGKGSGRANSFRWLRKLFRTTPILQASPMKCLTNRAEPPNQAPSPPDTATNLMQCPFPKLLGLLLLTHKPRMLQAAWFEEARIVALLWDSRVSSQRLRTFSNWVRNFGPSGTRLVAFVVARSFIQNPLAYAHEAAGDWGPSRITIQVHTVGM